MTDSPTYREVTVEDALEQQAPVAAPSGDGASPGLADEVPEADALEQAAAARPEVSAEISASDVLTEVNEADAAEQMLEVELDDDYDR